MMDFFLRAESFYNVATEIERLDSESAIGSPVIRSWSCGRENKANSITDYGRSLLPVLTDRCKWAIEYSNLIRCENLSFICKSWLLY